jgi:mono/diheme cytochrome c family protein
MRRNPKRFSNLEMLAASSLVVALAAGGLGLVGCGDASRRSQDSRRERIARGEYLVKTTACDDCHTPWVMGADGPKPDLSRRLSGHPQELELTLPERMPEGWLWAGNVTNTAFAGPWGVSFASNLTPDLQTGLGTYTEESFVQALRSGKHMGVGRPILPPMPWPSFAAMSDDDLGAMFAYLNSLEAVRNQVPAPLAPAPAEAP